LTRREVGRKNRERLNDGTLLTTTRRKKGIYI